MKAYINGINEIKIRKYISIITGRYIEFANVFILYIIINSLYTIQQAECIPDQVWSILPALELVPLNLKSLRHEQSRGSSSKAGKMDQSWYKCIPSIVQDNLLCCILPFRVGTIVQANVKELSKGKHWSVANWLNVE